MTEIDINSTPAPEKKRGGRRKQNEHDEHLEKVLEEQPVQEELKPAPEYEYPKIIWISNKSPTFYVIPQLNWQLRPGELNSSALVAKDQLSEIMNNAETFNAVNGWDGDRMGIVINFEKDNP